MTTENISPLEIADFSLVHIHQGTPHCAKHGAMNKMTKHEDGGGIWRCITLTGYKTVMNGNSKGEVHMETICRAGCVEKYNTNE